MTRRAWPITALVVPELEAQLESPWYFALAQYVPARACTMVHVAWPDELSVDAAQSTVSPFGPVTSHDTSPVGETPAPLTVAVKVKVLPATLPEASSDTTVAVDACPM
jgi:hypothetical protein